jgi:hypothetical protein
MDSGKIGIYRQYFTDTPFKRARVAYNAAGLDYHLLHRLLFVETASVEA